MGVRLAKAVAVSVGTDSVRSHLQAILRRASSGHEKCGQKNETNEDLHEQRSLLQGRGHTGRAKQDASPWPFQRCQHDGFIAEVMVPLQKEAQRKPCN
eukprot:1160422-Pelagomonas_calceolata.AAC.2